jgi:hypothetical protein
MKEVALNIFDAVGITRLKASYRERRGSEALGDS